MDRDYYGLLISCLCVRHRWKWQIALPYGVQLTSNEDYPNPEKALVGAERWIISEAAFNAINSCLSQLYGRGTIDQPEYTNLIESLRRITKRC